MRTAALATLVLLGTSIFCLGSAELALRVAGFREVTPRVCPGQRTTRPSERFIVDTNVGWRMRPGASFRFDTEGESVAYHADAEGFRSMEAARSSTPSRSRVAIIGDSFGWGYGVGFEDSLAGRLQHAFPSAEVRNFAMPGFGLDQTWLALRHWALPFEPDVVVAVVYPDDFERSLSAFRISEGFAKPAFRLENGELVERTVDDCAPAPFRFIERHSRIFALARRFERRMARELAVGDGWSLNARILEELQADAQKAGTKLVIVHVPYPTLSSFQALSDHMGKDTTPFVDLAEDFAEHPERFYFPEDGHLNALGHERMAERVGREMARLLGDLAEGR